jgi:PEGA domain-containing protein
MALKSFIIPLTFTAALALSAPASAQHGGGNHTGGHIGGGHAGTVQHGDRGSFHGGDNRHNTIGSVRGRDGLRLRDGRGFGGPLVHARVIHPFRGPFFAFRPRFNLGFGLFVGYPFAYPWDYVALDPYYYPYDVDPYGWTYGEPQDLSSAPSYELRNYGGISLDITPGDASVVVDGTDAGTAQTFSPSSAPLTLAPGQHHIVIEKPGYQSMTFDADVIQGQVIPYKGTMQPE